jgi:3-oxoadipate enol-lactonase
MLLHHTDTGSGTAVLLLHAGVCDSRMWTAQVVDLSLDHRMLVPDLRGFGESPLPAERYSDAGDVLALLDHLDVDRFAVVGASRGGAVAQQVATAVPDRVAALVLLCSAGDGVEPTADVAAFAAQENALLEAGDVDAATDLNVRTWLGPEADDDARELVQEMQAHAFAVQLAAGDVEDEELPVDLASLGMPALVVSGQHDLELFRALARHLAAGLPRAELVELPWAGHLPTLERPTEGTSLIRYGISLATSST